MQKVSLFTSHIKLIMIRVYAEGQKASLKNMSPTNIVEIRPSKTAFYAYFSCPPPPPNPPPPAATPLKSYKVMNV